MNSLSKGAPMCAPESDTHKRPVQSPLSWSYRDVAAAKLKGSLKELGYE